VGADYSPKNRSTTGSESKPAGRDASTGTSAGPRIDTEFQGPVDP
jgi:hypothetical protein